MDFIKNGSNILKNNNKINKDLLDEEKNKNIQLNNRIKQLEIDLNNEKEWMSKLKSIKKI